MKRFLLLLSVMVLLPLCAFAVTTVPEGVTAVEDEAFANTAIDALIIPASVQTVGANVLAGSDASYLYLQGASTTLASGAGVPFVFGPSNSSAAGLDNFYPTENLALVDGVYYEVMEDALPLCAKSPASLSGTVTIPKLVNGRPVTSLDVLYLTNTGVTALKIPQYLTNSTGLTATAYQTMFLTAPVASKATVSAGRSVTWTTTIEGAYGSVSYLWTFDVNGETTTTITDEPTVTFAPQAEGTCTVTVTAEDALGDKAASAVSEALTVTEAEPTYRALLVGNTYPGASNALAGPDNDVKAVSTMLNSMSGTDYQVRTAMNQSASGIRSAIASTFSGAKPGDVSLFYYSGHGNADGSLVGVGDTLLSVYSLRTALQDVPGTKIVILDCCYSGTVINRSADATENSPSPSAFNSAIISAFASASRSASRSAENLEDEGYIVLTSCRKDQTSATLVDDITGTTFGVFTYGLCYGSGYDEWKKVSLGSLPADTNGDRAITLGEAYTRIRERVSYMNGLAGGALGQETQSYGDSSFVLWRK